MEEKKLKVNTTLTSLQLRLKNIDTVGIIALANALKTNTTLKTLNLVLNNISADDASILAEALKTNVGLTELELGGNCIGDEGTRAIAEALTTNTTLKSVNLPNNNIDDEGAKALSEALQKNTSLTTLNLADNNISAIGAKVLANAIKTNSALTSLVLFRNPIAHGALSIADALKENNSLTLLNLYNCNIDYHAAAKIAEALKSNTSLTSLNLCANYLGDYGALCFAHTLITNTSLRSLDLSNSHIGDEGAAKIAETLKNNFTLTKLDLFGNSIDDSILKEINFYLTRNRGLKAFEDMVSPSSGSELRQSATDHLSDAINELKDLADTQPEARDALALFVIKFSDNGMIDNALELFAQHCIDNESAAEALFYTLHAPGEAQNIFSDGFPQEVRYLLLWRLGKKFLTKPENEKILRRVLFGLKTGKQAIGEPPSLAELTGVDNPKMSSEALDKLNKLVEKLGEAIAFNDITEENLTELLNITRYLANGEVDALSQEMRSVIANVKEQITLDDELLQLYHYPQSFIPYEDLVFKAERNQNNTSKTTDYQASVVPLHKQTLTELLEQAINNLTPIEVQEEGSNKSSSDDDLAMPQAEHLSLIPSASDNNGFPESQPDSEKCLEPKGISTTDNAKKSSSPKPTTTKYSVLEMPMHWKKKQSPKRAANTPDPSLFSKDGSIKGLLSTVFGNTPISIMTLPLVGTTIKFKEEPSVTEAEMYLRELSGKGLDVTFKKADQVTTSFTIPAKITITNSPEDIRSILSSPINQHEPAEHMQIDPPTTEPSNCTIS